MEPITGYPVLKSRIYHICLESAWKAQLGANSYSDPSLQSEGFIHCSMKEQLESTLKRYFSNQNELVILEILPVGVADMLRMEPAAESQERFPHVYGPIPKSAILQIFRFDGTVKIEELLST